MSVDITYLAIRKKDLYRLNLKIGLVIDKCDELINELNVTS